MLQNEGIIGYDQLTDFTVILEHLTLHGPVVVAGTFGTGFV